MTSKFALVIANTEYEDASFAKLTAPGKDAEEFAHILREPELAAFDDVQVLLNEEESKIRRSIARFFVNRKHDDLLLLYFSGHGVRNEQGQLFLAANDTEISILEATGIPAEFITRAMNNSLSQRQLLILDCCNSGAFAYGSKSASGVGKSMGIATAFEGDGYGRVVLTATDATQFAWEGDKVIGDTQKSVFTHFLIEGLKGEADRDGDGRIKVDELYDYAYEQVVRRTPKQTPGKWSYKQQGDMILREDLKPRDVKPAPLPSDMLDLLSHPNSGVRKVGVQDLISLLDGKHLGLARGAEEKLREIAAIDDSFTLRKNASDALIAHGFEVEVITPSIKSESLATSFKALNESTPVEKPVPVKSRKKLSVEPKRSLDEHVTEPEKIARKQSVAAETPNKEREARKIEKPPQTSPVEKTTTYKLSTRLISGIVAGLLIISLLIWGSSKLFLNLPTTTPEPTHITQESTFSTSALGIGSTMTGKDGMVHLYVPAGEFTMGNNNGDSDVKPFHEVNLDAFWIDQTEVTNNMYAFCVDADVCQEPTNTISSTHSSYYGNSEYDNYPVIYVDWNMAKTYCEWADRRLPTEAEWEKAARGTDMRIYPWGNEIRTTFANYNSVVGDTVAVGSYKNQRSFYGAYDMAGNAEEWVSSIYKPYPYDTNDGREDMSSSGARVRRGGAWDDNFRGILSTYRGRTEANYSRFDLGFRCAMSASP